jgi:hypothetical protein
MGCRATGWMVRKSVSTSAPEVKEMGQFRRKREFGS